MKTISYSEKSSAPFNSSMLNIGEMMELQGIETDWAGQIVLRTYDSLLLLNTPSIHFSIDSKLLGRKLDKGEGITLIQE